MNSMAMAWLKRMWLAGAALMVVFLASYCQPQSTAPGALLPQLGARIDNTSVSGISSLPFGSFLMVMQPIHLAIGLVEGIVTGAILIFVHQARPELLASVQSKTPLERTLSLKKIVIGGLIANGLEPDDVAAQVVDAINTRRFYVITHPEWMPMVTGRTRRIAEGADPGIAGGEESVAAGLG